MNEKKNFFRASAEDFKKIPGSPIAYWVSKALISTFSRGISVDDISDFTGSQHKTADNEKYLRFWWEPERAGIESKDWVFYAKGGEYRKWYGNIDLVVDWTDSAKEFYRTNPTSNMLAEKYWFKEGITYTSLSSSFNGFRYLPPIGVFDIKGPSLIDVQHRNYCLGFFNSKIARIYFKQLNATMTLQVKDVKNTPLIIENETSVDSNVSKFVVSARDDWNSYETTWDFTVNPLVARGIPELAACYSHVRLEWKQATEEMRRLETENNRIFIEAYGLQDELTPDVPWNEITLTCNPWYRYGKIAPNDSAARANTENAKDTEKLKEEVGVLDGALRTSADSAFFASAAAGKLPMDRELEARLQADTVKELISYAVGCMMGRYSLKKPGLILADQGATLEDYWEKLGIRNEELGIGEFAPDDDGIIPVLDNDLFADDIVTRFKEFIKKAFGETHYFQNIEWIESTLGKSIRDYFTKDFYKDHLQKYQNRPIYWMFQSPKGAFRALIYMHRYTPDMVGRVLGYLRSLQTKIENMLNLAMQIAADESKANSERVRANKEVVKLTKVAKELDEYEKHVLYPLSTERIEIDLDDGVKANYGKFGSALKKVTALEGRGE